MIAWLAHAARCARIDLSVKRFMFDSYVPQRTTVAAAEPFWYDSSMKTTNVLHRVLEPILRSLPPEAARQIARAEADEELQKRVEELACKANEGTLTAEERSEYEAYVDAGDIVATLQAVARKTLQSVAG